MAERNRRRIAVLIYSMVNAVLFGIGLLIVLLMPLMLSHRPSAPTAPITSLQLGSKE